MSFVDVSLLSGAILAALLAWRTPRGVLWIVAGALSYTVSVIYWRSGLPYAEGIAGLCDAAVCIAIYFFGRERWEMLIWRLFQTSVAINFLYLAGNIGVFYGVPHDAYSAMLEAINWLALILIAGNGLAQMVGASLGDAHRPWHRFRNLARALRTKRARDPFTKAT